MLQYKSDEARNRLKGGFKDGPNLTTVNLIGYNALSVIRRCKIGYNMDIMPKIGYNAV